MSRGSVASLVAATAVAAIGAVVPAGALALAPGFGKGPTYCAAYGNTASRYSYDDVYACESVASLGPTPFDADGKRSFQCVELSARFLWAVYGIWAGPGTGVKDGADLVSVINKRYPSIRWGFPAPGSVPVAGDVVSLGPGGAVNETFGHTAIVISANQRRGRFAIIGQNFPLGEAGEQTLTVDLRGRHNGRALLNGVWTPASWLELRHRRRH
jgi:CHAP domain